MTEDNAVQEVEKEITNEQAIRMAFLSLPATDQRAVDVMGERFQAEWDADAAGADGKRKIKGMGRDIRRQVVYAIARCLVEHEEREAGQ